MRRNSQEKRGTNCLPIPVRPLKNAQVLGHSQEGEGRKDGETGTDKGRSPAKEGARLPGMGTKWDVWGVNHWTVVI